MNERQDKAYAERECVVSEKDQNLSKSIFEDHFIYYCYKLY